MRQRLAHRFFAQPDARRPGHHGIGQDERSDHGHRYVDRNGPHEGPHHAADKGHRHEGQNHRQRGHIGGIADLVGRLNHRSIEVLDRPAMQVAVDVLDHHNGAIDQQTQRENEREQGDAVDALADDQIDREHGEQRQRHGERHDAGLAPAEEKPQQQRHADNGDAQMLHQRVHRLVGLVAVVAGHGDMHALRQRIALDLAELGEHIVHHDHGIGARFFGDGQGDRAHLLTMRLALGGQAPSEVRQIVHLFRPFGDLGHILQIDRLAVWRADKDVAHLLCVAEEAVDAYRGDLVAIDQITDGRRRVAALQNLVELFERNAGGRQLARRNRHVHRTRRAPHHFGERHPGHVAQMGQHLLTHVAQLHAIHRRGRQREGEDGHVVHVDRLDHRLHCPGGNAVEVLHQLVVHLDQAFFLVFAHFELHCDHAEIVGRIAIGVIDAGHRGHDGFERLDHQILDLLRPGPRLGDDDVRRRHHDLRVVFARRDQQRQHPGEGEADHDQGGDF